jgi:hypothetical protein
MLYMAPLVWDNAFAFIVDDIGFGIVENFPTSLSNPKTPV